MCTFRQNNIFNDHDNSYYTYDFLAQTKNILMLYVKQNIFSLRNNNRYIYFLNTEALSKTDR